MQRQSVPLLYSEAPLIGTGLEGQTARDSGMTTLSLHNGKVIRLNEGQIFVKDKKGTILQYVLSKYQRSNQDTCINQHPLVSVNEKVLTGQVLQMVLQPRRGTIRWAKHINCLYALGRL